MTMMSPLKRGARAANQPTPRRLNDERNNPVKLLRRAKLLMLSAAVALAALAAGMTTAVPAYAKSTASISAYGGPGEIWVTGSGFPAYATVRIEALSNPGLSYVGYAQYIPADGSGNITGGFAQNERSRRPPSRGPSTCWPTPPLGLSGRPRWSTKLLSFSATAPGRPTTLVRRPAVRSMRKSPVSNASTLCASSCSPTSSRCWTQSTSPPIASGTSASRRHHPRQALRCQPGVTQEGRISSPMSMEGIRPLLRQFGYHLTVC